MTKFSKFFLENDHFQNNTSPGQIWPEMSKQTNYTESVKNTLNG